MSTKTLSMAVVTAAFASLTLTGVAWANNGQNNPAEPTVAQPTGGQPAPGTWDNFDPVYNVCRGTDPRCYHPWVDNRENKVLIYTRTAGPRHANLGTALPPGKNPPLGANNIVQTALVAWMAEQGVAADWTEDVTQLSNVIQYKAVFFASTSGCCVSSLSNSIRIGDCRSTSWRCASGPFSSANSTRRTSNSPNLPPRGNDLGRRATKEILASLPFSAMNP